MQQDYSLDLPAIVDRGHRELLDEGLSLPNGYGVELDIDSLLRMTRSRDPMRWQRASAPDGLRPMKQGP
jgi:hypothetical protein